MKNVSLIHLHLKERVIRMFIFGIIYRIRKESGLGGAHGGGKEKVDLPGTCPVPSPDLILEGDKRGRERPQPRGSLCLV